MGKDRVKDFLRFVGLQCHAGFEDIDREIGNLKCH